MDATPLPIAEADLKTLVGTMRDMPRDSVDLDVVSSAVCRFGLHPVQATVNELVFGLGRSQQRMSRVLYAHLSMVVMYFRRSRHHSSVRDGCDLFEQLITQYLTDVATVLATVPEGDARLVQYSRCWLAHRLITQFMVKLFADFDIGNPFSKDALTQNGCVCPVSLTTFSVRAFKNVVFTGLAASIVHCVHDIATRDRNDVVVDRSIAKDAVDLFQVICNCDAEEFAFLKDDKDTERRLVQGSNPDTENKSFDLLFAVPFLKHTENYYRAVANDWIFALDVPTYLVKVEAALQKESTRSVTYLPASTHRDALNVARSALLGEHYSSIVLGDRGGMMQLLKNVFAHQISGTAAVVSDMAKLKSLETMFTLFFGDEEASVHKINAGHDLMVKTFVEFIDGVGQQLRVKLITQRETLAADGTPGKVNKNDHEYVDQLLLLLSQGKALVSTAFMDDVDMSRALWRGMEKVLNKDEAHPELIATYMDSLAKGKHGKDTISEDDIIDFGNTALELLRYIADKDVLRDFYLVFLGRRLLTSKSSSMTAEKMAITKMKDICGPHYSNKFETMITDFLTVSDSNTKYKSRPSCPLNSNFGVHALTASCWPMKLMPQFQMTVLPPSMQICQRDFTEYWAHTTCNAKKLHWVWGQGSASVSVQFAEPASTKTLVVTTLQAVVLMAFNVRPQFTIAELIAMTGLDMDVMKRIVGSLSAVKGVAVVKKTPKVARISDTDVVELDSTFKHPKREFALPAPFFDNISERTGPSKEVCEDRKFMVDACIVRTMKARNCMEHQALLQEVVMQIRYFVPDVKLVKQRIEAMIAQSYIKRQDPDLHTSPYIYVAQAEEDS